MRNQILEEERSS